MYSYVGMHNAPRASALWFLPLLMFSVYMWGYFCLAYICHSNVSVPSGSWRYNKAILNVQSLIFFITFNLSAHIVDKVNRRPWLYILLHRSSYLITILSKIFGVNLRVLRNQWDRVQTRNEAGDLFLKVSNSSLLM